MKNITDGRRSHQPEKKVSAGDMAKAFLVIIAAIGGVPIPVIIIGILLFIIIMVIRTLYSEGASYAKKKDKSFDLENNSSSSCGLGNLRGAEKLRNVKYSGFDKRGANSREASDNENSFLEKYRELTKKAAYDRYPDFLKIFGNASNQNFELKSDDAKGSHVYGNTGINKKSSAFGRKDDDKKSNVLNRKDNDRKSSALDRRDDSGKSEVLKENFLKGGGILLNGVPYAGENEPEFVDYPDFCPYCGAKLGKKKTKICGKCGRKII